MKNLWIFFFCSLMQGRKGCSASTFWVRLAPFCSLNDTYSYRPMYRLLRGLFFQSYINLQFTLLTYNNSTQEIVILPVQKGTHLNKSYLMVCCLYWANLDCFLWHLGVWGRRCSSNRRADISLPLPWRQIWYLRQEKRKALGKKYYFLLNTAAIQLKNKQPCDNYSLWQSWNY